jgi:hypothetical protein
VHSGGARIAVFFGFSVTGPLVKSVQAFDPNVPEMMSNDSATAPTANFWSVCIWSVETLVAAARRIAIYSLPPDFKIARIVSGAPLLTPPSQFSIGEFELANGTRIGRHAHVPQHHYAT